MNGKDQQVEMTEVLALGLATTAMVHICAGLIRRLATTPDELARLLEQLNREALRQVKGAVGDGLPIEQEAEVMRRACEKVEGIFQGWRGQPPREDVNPP